MSRALTEIRFPPGTDLWREGETALGVFLVTNGRCAAAAPKGLDFEAGPGFPLGAAEAVAEVPRWYEAVTETRVTGLQGPIETLLDVFEDNFELARHYLAVHRPRPHPRPWRSATAEGGACLRSEFPPRPERPPGAPSPARIIAAASMRTQLRRPQPFPRLLAMGHGVGEGGAGLRAAERRRRARASSPGPAIPKELLAQMDSLGVGSLSIVVLTGMFTGMVLALQSSATLDVFGARPYVGRLVCVSMVRELGPVLTALMVTGRVGSGMAAELGSMVVTQQIDALRVLGTDPDPTPGGASPGRRPGDDPHPHRHLERPRHLRGRAHQHLQPQALLGVLLAQRGQRPRLQRRRSWASPSPWSSASSWPRWAVYMGLSTRGGTQGVGVATTRSVVVASVLILASDFFMTKVLLLLFPVS